MECLSKGLIIAIYIPVFDALAIWGLVQLISNTPERTESAKVRSAKVYIKVYKENLDMDISLILFLELYSTTHVYAEHHK